MYLTIWKVLAIVAGMESNEAFSQLSDIERLKARTVSESSQGRPAALPLLVVATFLFFSSFEIDSPQWFRLVAGFVWTVFIVLWVRWVRSDNRVRPSWRSSGPTARRHIVTGWIVGLTGASLAGFIGTRVSWVLAGALMAAVVAGGGIFLQAVWGK